MDYEDGFNPFKINDEGYLKGWIEWILKDDSISTFLDEGECLDESTLNVDPLGFALHLVDSKGGRQGGGEDVWYVYAICQGPPEEEQHYNCSVIKNAFVYIRFNGFYSSYNGTEWDDDFVVVKPKVVESVVFESVK